MIYLRGLFWLFVCWEVYKETGPFTAFIVLTIIAMAEVATNSIRSINDLIQELLLLEEKIKRENNGKLPNQD
jgi:hypothetical protein